MEKWLPTLFALLGLVAVAAWFCLEPATPAALRLPDTLPISAAASIPSQSPDPAGAAGIVIPGPGIAAAISGSWPCFRGAQRNGIAQDAGALLPVWPVSGPTILWQQDVGEGYAGPAVLAGRVYLHDYDAVAHQDAIRCLSLDDGREIWRFVQPLTLKRNHGMTRTVPAVTANALVALNPKCQVTCLDPVTGALQWQLDLVRDFGAEVPPWYAGQCPLIDGDRVLLAPGGEDLVIAVSLDDGRVLWRTPNPAGWKMTHASIVPMLLAGRPTYVYSASGGVIGVDAADGRELWRTDQWKIRIATIASPVPVDAHRLFLSGGYDAGCLLVTIDPVGDRFLVKPLFRLPAERFGATQQTPIVFENHLYGIRPDGELACIDLEGRECWHSGPQARFGLGPFLLAGRHIYAVDDTGTLAMCAADPGAYRPVSRAAILTGHDAWGPLALAGGRLLMRDLTHLVCVQVGVAE